MELEEQLKIDDGHRFQKKLGEVIIANNLKVIMETGTGVSSVYMLDALDKANIEGNLYSIDIGAWYPHEILHPKFHPIKAKSIDAILPLYLEVGAFELAVLDGCHEILEQSYEYEIMWQMLKPGGYIVFDDINWNQNGAYHNFLNRHFLKEEHFDNARIIQKPLDAPVLGVEVTEHGTSFNKDAVIEFHTNWLAHCIELEKEWLAKGNKKHPAFE